MRIYILFSLAKLYIMYRGGSIVTKSHNPMDCSPPGSSVRGISQVKTLEWVTIAFSRDLPIPGKISCLVGGFLHCRKILYC